VTLTDTRKLDRPSLAEELGREVVRITTWYALVNNARLSPVTLITRHSSTSANSKKEDKVNVPSFPLHAENDCCDDDSYSC
jgi:hypothetical protein